MHHAMRRKDRALSDIEALAILDQAEYGVLATVGEDGWPYAVPVNHVLSGDSIYLHCAMEGHKLLNIAHESRVSYCVVGRAKVLPEQFSTLYESAIAFGRVTLLRDDAERRLALEALARRFAPGLEAEVDRSIQKHFDHTAILQIRIEWITGKAHR
jgi:hypothetical protein